MKLIAQKSFSWAHRGVDIKHFEEGDEIETEDQDLIDVSTREGWTTAADGEVAAPSKPGRKSKPE